MLTITVPAAEFFDESLNKFIQSKAVTLDLEHSLVSLSKWEQKWKKPFFGKGEKTTEQTIDYIKCMCLTPDVPPEVFTALSPEIAQQISAYVEDPMTATWFNEGPGPKKTTSEIITSELVYYWMTALQIDWQAQYWHLNRLLTLVRVINLKNDPKKKTMPKREAAQMQRDLNAERKARLGTRG